MAACMSIEHYTKFRNYMQAAVVELLGEQSEKIVRAIKRWVRHWSSSHCRISFRVCDHIIILRSSNFLVKLPIYTTVRCPNMQDLDVN